MTVPAAVSTLPVQCADLQAAAKQAQQGACRPGYVPRSGSMKLCILINQGHLTNPVTLSCLPCHRKLNKSTSVSQVGHCYLQQLATFPQELTELLLSHHTVLDSDLRMVRDNSQRL